MHASRRQALLWIVNVLALFFSGVLTGFGISDARKKNEHLRFTDYPWKLIAISLLVAAIPLLITQILAVADKWARVAHMLSTILAMQGFAPGSNVEATIYTPSLLQVPGRPRERLRARTPYVRSNDYSGPKPTATQHVGVGIVGSCFGEWRTQADHFADQDELLRRSISEYGMSPEDAAQQRLHVRSLYAEPLWGPDDRKNKGCYAVVFVRSMRRDTFAQAKTENPTPEPWLTVFSQGLQSLGDYIRS